MKKKSFITIIMAVFSLGLLTSCGKEEKDLIKEDLICYFQDDIQTIMEQESVVIQKYNELCEISPETDVDAVLEELNNNILPEYKQFLEDLKAVTPETQEVQDVKKMYEEGATLQYEAMVMVAEALKENDEEKLQETDDKIQKAKNKLDEYKDALSTLAEQHNIVIHSTETTTAE